MKTKKKPKNSSLTDTPKEVTYSGDSLNKKKPQKKKNKKPKKGNYARNEEYPALNPRRQVYARREAMEGDYYHKLNDEEKAWLNAFLSETVVTNFYHDGPEIYTKVEDKRQFYRENNYRNKDALNWARARSAVLAVEDVANTLDREHLEEPTDIEDSWIEAINLKQNGELEKSLVITDKELLKLGITREDLEKLRKRSE